MQLNLTYQVPFTESLEGANFIIQGTAINETTTSNNHKFLAEELMPAANTLTGCPLLVDHENKVENIKGRVMMGSYNELGKKIDFKAMVMDEECKKMIRDGRLNSVSVGAMVKDVEEIDGELIPRGITFKELSLVAVPADSNATFSIAMSQDLNQAFGIALKEAYNSSKPKIDLKEVVEVKEAIEPEDLKKGMDYERKEHPSLSEDVIKKIASDHLAEDEDYYKDETETEDKADIQQKNTDDASKLVKDVAVVDNQESLKGGLEKMSEIVETAKVDESLALKAQLETMAKEMASMKEAMAKSEVKEVLRNEFDVTETVEKDYRIVQDGNSFTYQW